MRTFLAISVISGLLLSPTTVLAAEYELNPGEDVEAAIAMLQPGDELILHGGMYSVTERFSIEVSGTEAAPIIVRAADGEIPHINRPNASENLVDIDNSEYIEFHGIEWSGGSAGIRMSNVRNLTIRNCDIHDTGDVAVRANDGGVVYDGLHIVGNNIHDTNYTGEGMYLGCNDNGCQVQNSIIELNWIHHTNGPTIEQGDGIELKEGSHSNIIRHNVIHDTNYPCILVYSTVGNGDANIIEGNVMWNCGDHGIQAAADATIRNNIVFSAAADGIAMQPHQAGSPSNLMVVHNTVVIPNGTAISVSGASGAVTLANNAVYTMGGSAISVGGDTSGITVAGNVGMGGFGGGAGYVDGNFDADFVAGNWSGAPPNDVFPAMGGALVGAGDPAYAYDEDFNTLPLNDPPDAGAYAYDPDGNPGWEIQAGFKGFPDDIPGGTESDSGDGDSGDSVGDESNGDGDSNGETGNGDAGPGTNGSVGDESGGGTAGADGGDGGDEGCGCRSTNLGSPAALALLALFGVGRRRRSRVGS